MLNYTLIRNILAALIFVVSLRASAETTSNPQKANEFAKHIFDISQVLLHDVVNPPAASRFYAYSLLGAYMVVLNENNKLPDFLKKFKEPLVIDMPLVPKHFEEAFCANYAMLEVGKHIIPSGYLLADKQTAYIQSYKKRHRISKKVMEENIGYATLVAEQVVNYAKTDGYSRLSTFTRYTPKREEGHWYPTPPTYISAIEPNWITIRPFFMDSASQFVPNPPAPYDLDKSSSFYQQTMEVYESVKSNDAERREIANFWDCNPFAVTYSGHMAIGLKKISPGGHWIGITGIACEKAGISLDSTVLIHTLVALTLYDAFISCWHEKYRSNRIRPESVINRNIDKAWKPILQTPPFPEYTSGHSVVSSASAVVLTNFLGDNFSFEDSSEVYFGLPVRNFTSFYQASDEAAISRLYGGIHFRDAIEEGVTQGRAIGNHILRRVFPETSLKTE